MKVKVYEEEFAGKPLKVEIGRLANIANGSVYVQYGNTAVLVTAVMSPSAKSGIDYMPLSVDYEERYYAAGKIKGSKWMKREGRPSDEAILSGRLIDRSLRPRFDHRIRNDMQVVATILSFDGQNDPDIPALFGASLALMISDIPFNGPVASVRVGKIDGKLIFNPTYDERVKSCFDIVVAGTSNRINMIEAGASIVPEKEVVEAVASSFKEFQKLINLQQKIADDIKPKKRQLALAETDPKLKKNVIDFLKPRLEKVIYTKSKQEYVEGMFNLRKELIAHIQETHKTDPDLAGKNRETEHLFDGEINDLVHNNILDSEKRPDFRKLDEVRELSADIAILPHTHGSGLFQRGTTQVLSILTLASPGMEQWVETMEIDLTKKRFMHHYSFPPYSVGEVGRMGGTGRRDIGHGALAERALIPVIPSKDDFPYTIRMVSETLASNGSSSMGSVCGSSLALMDGGVPITSAVAGIAMGVMFDKDGKKYKILTDIQGPEDHHGDMDFKVAGTKDGITAMQMDVKVEGITEEVLEKALQQAKKARLDILEVMNAKISQPRPDLSPTAPRVKVIKINPEKIGAVIGKGGETINKIIEETNADINIEDDGTVFITCVSADGMKRAIEIIGELTFEASPGDEFDGHVSRLLDFGAMVEYLPGREGLVHVSEISKERIRRPSDVLKIGQKVHVKVKNIDEYGRINLTIK
ncbi:MAG: polyribonucleotide nucleotidyltransferase [Candidatus Yanofskybacteria bacterium RIFCSPHIGHO2_01_FULL_39_44]|nr:MAG: polyribonucleotide nucleotidyltransferase [Candidatus Yanofskybacteria bacterium RIFCSPHIGHO2_01_FULL_39_44]